MKVMTQKIIFPGKQKTRHELSYNADKHYAIFRYLNDLFTLELRSNSNQLQWEIPSCFGSPPPARESHSAVACTDHDGSNPRLIIFGGMSGCRLGDLWILNIGKLMFL